MVGFTADRNGHVKGWTLGAPSPSRWDDGESQRLLCGSGKPRCCRRLVPEIFDLIVDHLRDDRKALKACCLVSKEWIPRARRHIFACIMFDLQGVTTQGNADECDTPSTSQRLTESLHVLDLTPPSCVDRWTSQMFSISPRSRLHAPLNPANR